MEIPSKSPLLLVSLLLFSFMFLPLSLHAICNPNDKEVLLQIQEAAGNPPDMVSAWNLANDCCSSWAINCNSDGRVTYFFAFRSNRNFELPSRIGNLEFLQSFTFVGLHGLIGTIPPSIKRLKYLEQLAIYECSLNGTIPNFLGQMKSLKRIDLNSNQLSGSIPHSLGHLPNLTELDLSVNKLTGHIAKSFGLLKNLEKLVLSFNQLSGSIPKSLRNLNLSYIDLSRNNLRGDASFLLGPGKTSLGIFYLRSNKFSFNFSNIEIPSSLGGFDVSFNKIYGSLPPSITKPFYEDGFNVSYNRLCGPIPNGLQYLDDAASAFIGNKCLCGSPLPPC
ncbi:hypothetical protein Ancab_039556 [Ancistrocladus abbreviatus]